MKRLLFLVALATLLAPSAHAQNSAPVSAKTNGVVSASSNPVTFADCVHTVADRFKVGVVAEDRPLRSTLSKDSAEALRKALATDVKAEDALRHIADAFDYEPEQKPSCWVFRKKYTDVEDIPDVTAGEIEQFLASVLAAGKGLYAGELGDFPAQMQKLKADQQQFKQALTSDAQRHVIAIRDLDASQRPRLQTLLMFHLCFMQMNTWEVARREIAHYDDPHSVFFWVSPYKDTGIAELFYRGPFGADDALWNPLPISPRYAALDRRTRSLDLPLFNQQQAAQRLQDRGAPYPEYTTLAAIAAQVFDRTVPYRAESAVAQKHVSVWGMSYAPRLRILQEATDLYNLRIIHRPGFYTVGMLTARQARSLEEWAAEVRRLSPPALFRQLERTTLALAPPPASPRRDRLTAQAYHNAMRAVQARNQQKNGIITRTSEQMQRASLAHLYTLLTAVYPDTSAKPLLIRNVSGEIKSLLAMTRLAGEPLTALYEIRDTRTPLGLQHLDDCFLQVALADDGAGLSTFQLVYPGTTGTLEQPEYSLDLE